MRKFLTTFLLLLMFAPFATQADEIADRSKDATTGTTDLYVSPSGWAMWGYEEPEFQGETFSIGFEDGSFMGWTNIDADGDGNVWMLCPPYNGSNYAIGSESYDVEPLTPDNYFVSPEKYSIIEGSILSFYVAAGDADWPSEHYGVAVSTTGNTSASDFTTIWEETLTAKGSGVRGERGDSRAYGNWYLKTIDLSEYAGQEIYIALRHFNSVDNFWIIVDNIALGSMPTDISYDLVFQGETIMENTKETSCLLDVTDLTVGNQYTTKIVVKDGNNVIDEKEYTWTYTSCEEFAGVTNLTADATVDGEVSLSWTMPEGDMIGVMVYRDGNLLTPEPFVGTSCMEVQRLPVGEYVYEVMAVYGGETPYAISCAEEVSVIVPVECIAPKSLFGEYKQNESGNYGAALEWSYNITEEWLYYDDGVYTGEAVGNFPLSWAVMFPAAALTSYEGLYLSTVSMYLPLQSEGAFGEISIYMGGDYEPGNLVYSQAYGAEPADDFVDYELNSPVLIDPTQNLWIVISNETPYFAAACASNCGDPNSRWLYYGGVWMDMYAASSAFDFSWMVRGLLTNASRSDEVVLGDKTMRGAELEHYNVYRGTSVDNFELIGETTNKTYFDEVGEGTYYYQVTATYSENGIECESEPAYSYEDNTLNYIVVDATSIAENDVKGLMIYPNPTRDNLNITAENMNRITITNTLGQVVYDANVNSDNEVVNMTQFESGIYMINVATEDGMAVRRVTVVR